MQTIKAHFSDCKYIYTVVILTVIIAAAAGSVYESTLDAVLKERVVQTVTAADTADGRDIFFAALTNYAILLGLLFLSGFFKLGIMLNLAAMARMGFMAGFSSAAFVNAYGAKGLALTAAGIFSDILFWSAAIFCSAVSIRSSFRAKNARRQYLLSYIFLSIFTAAIFCAAAAVKGSATTIFMNKCFEIFKNVF